MNFAIIATSAVLALATGVASTDVRAQTSGFDAGTEGWTAVGDPAGPVTWSATGGNPGGHIIVVDSGSGGDIYFSAPGNYLGNKSSVIGGSLKFDLQQVISGGTQFDADDVRLVSGGVTLAFDTAINPGVGTWTSYAIPLIAGNWRVGSITGPIASDAQFAGVMSNLTGLFIRAEFATFTAERDYLDNVAMAPIPEPATLLMFGLGLMSVVSATRHRLHSLRSARFGAGAA